VTLDLTFHRPAQRFGLMSVYGVLAAAALGVARFIPIAKWLQPWWGCPLRETTGIPCMACGLTRAFDWEAHGHFARAFALTPVGALLPVGCAVLAVWGLAVLTVRAPVPKLELDGVSARVLRWTVIAAILGNWIYMVLTRKRA